MQIKEISIDRIKPDPNQPRKYFDPDVIKRMAQSIKTEGVINAIEIDSDYTIITGEMRWRAAKEAGLKTIPCRIINVASEDRFLRQFISNIHYSNVSQWDIAERIEELLKQAPRGVDRRSWLSEKIGISKKNIKSILVKLLDIT